MEQSPDTMYRLSGEFLSKLYELTQFARKFSDHIEAMQYEIDVIRKDCDAVKMKG